MRSARHTDLAGIYLILLLFKLEGQRQGRLPRTGKDTALRGWAWVGLAKAKSLTLQAQKLPAGQGSRDWLRPIQARRPRGEQTHRGAAGVLGCQAGGQLISPVRSCLDNALTKLGSAW